VEECAAAETIPADGAWGREGDNSAAAAEEHADEAAEGCRGQLWAAIAQVSSRQRALHLSRPSPCVQAWRLGFVLLTHAGRCLLHGQLQARRSCKCARQKVFLLTTRGQAVCQAQTDAVAAVPPSAASPFARSGAELPDARASDAGPSACHSRFAVAAGSRAAAALGMRLPPLTAEVQRGISSCFHIFSPRSHPDLISDVIASACAPVIRCAAAPHTALHDAGVFALLHAANFLDAPLLLRR
jgi:hypothetical protein